MNHEELKLQIGSNITTHRKRLGMTQAELAQRLNYSDKAVSKWERGESVPDVLTLTEIAQQFGIKVNDLIYTQEELEAPAPVPEVPEEEEIPDDPERIRHNRKIIQGLVSVLVWIVATTIYVLADSFGATYSWLVFFFVIPAQSITLLSLRSAWKMYNWNLALISIIMWSTLLCIHAITYIASNVNVWRMFLMGVLGQIAIVLWFKLIRKPKKGESRE